MTARLFAIGVASLLLTGCATRYATLHVTSRPDGASVVNLDTLAHLAATPAQAIVQRRFWIFERRRAEYRLRFRLVGSQDDIEHAIVKDGWYRTRKEAEAGARFTTVAGVLQPMSCHSEGRIP
jgi:hypothetical protein